MLQGHLGLALGVYKDFKCTAHTAVRGWQFQQQESWSGLYPVLLFSGLCGWEL